LFYKLNPGELKVKLNPGKMMMIMMTTTNIHVNVNENIKKGGVVAETSKPRQPVSMIKWSSKHAIQ